jgi:hypothetical protein
MESNTSNHAPLTNAQKLQAIVTKSTRLRQDSEQLKVHIHVLLNDYRALSEHYRLFMQRFKDLL